MQGVEGDSERTRILFVVSEDFYFLSHRVDFAKYLLARNYDVGVLCKSTGRAREIERLGIEVIPVEIRRPRLNVIVVLREAIGIGLAIRRFRPDLVHAVALRMIVLTSLSRPWLGRVWTVNAVAGMGSLFSGGRLALKHKLVRFILERLFRLIMGGRRVHTVFQNSEDYEMALRSNWVKPERVSLIHGVGIDVPESPDVRKPDPPIRFLFAGRLLLDKGVKELLLASRRLTEEGWDHQLTLAGKQDEGNPNSLTDAELEEFCDGKTIRWVGFASNVRKLMSDCDIVVLPSYREGFPKVLLEAGASSRAIITTDVVGCREICSNGHNGFLIQVRSAKSIAKAMIRYLRDPELITTMGENNHKLVKENYSDEVIFPKFMTLYQSLISSDPRNERGSR